MKPEEVLKKYWGHSSFRTLQEDIIQAVLDKQDVLALLPTGGGKSICFQVPAMMMEGICIVISPLIALMKDQVSNLNQRGIRAVAIYSGLSRREIDIALDNCIHSDVKFLYCSPERLKTEIFKERVSKMKVNLIAVDEAHCISQWGYDFRPSYREISDFRILMEDVKVIALTASATPEVVKDISDKLLFEEEKVFQKSFARPKLSYSVFKEENKEKKLLEILDKVPGSSVIYVRNRKKTRDISRFLQENHITADYYHAGLSNQQRERKQDDWISGYTRVIVATNAFGMGIDKPDVRTVIHLDVPDHMEAYYQEAGRAGRDGLRAYAILLYHADDVSRLEKRVSMEFPEISSIRHVYQLLANYYKLAVGSSEMASYDFNLHDFSTHSAIHPMEAYFSLKKLEEEGFIQLSESFFEPSKLHIPIDNETLYKFQVANETYDTLIKGILRIYGGELYTHFMKISERKIATEVDENVNEVVRKLEYLKQAEIVRYIPQNDSPKLTFLTQRYDAARLPVREKEYMARKNSKLSKMNAMVGYLNRDYCRSRIISEYFGERMPKECGVCDICIKNRQKGEELGDSQIYRQKIMELLTEPLSLDQLIENASPDNLILFSQVIREMVDQGDLYYQPDGKISPRLL